eukprot:6196398-Pleurochrysis_carterae.AAC.5
MTAVAPQRAPAERVLRPERRSEEQLHLPDEAALDKGACHQRRPGATRRSRAHTGQCAHTNAHGRR